MTEPTTRTLAVPGATLTYDVRPNDASDAPVLLLIGSPMGACGFVTLASHFTDRTVATYDPRASSGARRPTTQRSRRPRTTPTTSTRSSTRSAADRSTSSRAAAAPSTRWPSSPRHPEDVRLLVAHEPPSGRRPARSRRRVRRHPRHARHVPAERRRAGNGPVHHPRRLRRRDSRRLRRSAVPRSGDVRDAGRGRRLAQRPAASPRTSSPAPHYEPDFDALEAASTHLVIARGEESRIDACRACRRRDRRATRHDGRRRSRATTAGSSAASTGRPAEPDEFAAKLREVLAAQPVGV